MRDGRFVIVHVDDSLLAREMVREALEEEDFEVHSAEHAQDFEQRVMADDDIRQAVDFIILDMEMPDLTGAQVGAVMNIVFDELIEVPFMIYSAREREWVEGMAREVAQSSPGFQKNYLGYLGKSPSGAGELVEKVKYYLARLPRRERY